MSPRGAEDTEIMFIAILIVSLTMAIGCLSGYFFNSVLAGLGIMFLSFPILCFLAALIVVLIFKVIESE